MSRATPRPWKLSENYRVTINGADGNVVGDTFGTNYIRSKEESEANAAHIVKAVNMHESLVTALNGLLVANLLGGHVDQNAAIQFAKETLAKATAEGE